MKPKNKKQLIKEYKARIHRGKVNRKTKHKTTVNHLLNFWDVNPNHLYIFDDEGKMLPQSKTVFSQLRIVDNEDYLKVELLGSVYYMRVSDIIRRLKTRSSRIIPVYRHHNAGRHPGEMSFKEFDESISNYDIE